MNTQDTAAQAAQIARFHLGDVLSITTGRLLSPNHMAGIYAILNHLTGDNLFTHQIPRAMRECAPGLRDQFPALAGITDADVTPENHRQWLADRVAEHGEWFDVAPLPASAHEAKDPVREAVEMRGVDRVALAVAPPAAP